MKLLNKSLWYLSIPLLLVMTIWAVVFYVNVLNEIKSSIDEGLENSKRVIIENARKDSSILTKTYFDESFFTIHTLSVQDAKGYRDRYIDTTLFMQDADDEAPESEPVRMLQTSFELDGKHYELKVANSMLEEGDLIKELLKDIIWLYLLLICCIFIINNIMLRRLWKPFYDFLHRLKNFQLGRSREVPVIRTEITEFLDLQRAVTTLVDRAHTSFIQQKDFIGNASHELQTPLAIASGKVELLLEDDGFTEKQASELTAIHQIIQRLIKLNKSLLLLSKIDNRQFFENKRLYINAIIAEIEAELHAFSGYKQLTINSNLKVPVEIEMDNTLASILFSNLIRNAIFHTPDAGTVDITTSLKRFQISNTAANGPLNAAEIFQRFHRASATDATTGLGLAIVKAIVDLYEFSVDYEFVANRHQFTINFSPMAS